MVSLAGIPPLAGFFGKFLLLKAVISQGPANHGYYCLAFTAIVGVVISIYYYFGVIRAVYKEPAGDSTPIPISCPIRFAIIGCIVGMLWLGIFPGSLLNLANTAAGALGF
jgi:NADH-quinone oxidoreductase subunit N